MKTLKVKKYAFISGASKRIGKSIALYLGSKNYQLILHYNKSEKEIKYLKSILEKKYSIHVELIKGNLEKKSFFLKVIPYIKKKFKKLDLIIHNASIFLRSPFLKTTTKIFEKNFNINFRAPFFISRDYVNYFKSGHIINILDAKIHYHESKYTAYLLSKKALYQMSLDILKEIAPHFRINNIAPGYIIAPEEEINDTSYLKKEEKRIENIPLQKKPKIHHISKAIQFLINNPSLNGQTLYIDGGEHINS